MLFLLAIDPLQQILNMATALGILKPVQDRTTRLRTSLYAYNAGSFANPSKEELSATSHMLDVFADATGLRMYLIKTEVFPNRCEHIDHADTLFVFPAKLVVFPDKYLGLPLHIRHHRKVDLLPLIDKFGACIPSWRDKDLTRAGRVDLAKSILTAIPPGGHPLPRWKFKKMDKLARIFFGTMLTVRTPNSLSLPGPLEDCVYP